MIFGPFFSLQLACIFLSHSSAPMGCWTSIGEGLARAQDIGAHKTGSNDDPEEDDLLRRAFHCLLILDAQFSTILGRSPHIQQNVYNTPLPAQPPTPNDDLSVFYALTNIAKLQRTTLFTLVSRTCCPINPLSLTSCFSSDYSVCARLSHPQQSVGPPADDHAQHRARRDPGELATFVRRQALIESRASN